MHFQDDFNVDQFVLECRRRVQLEDLRDDLSVYLKILRSAMIELINKDYADFVNLSSNLVSSHSSSIYFSYRTFFLPKQSNNQILLFSTIQ